MYLDRIIRRFELEEFASMLLPHQKAVTGDGKYGICEFSQIDFYIVYRIVFVFY